jgi:hypothetical protein
MARANPRLGYHYYPDDRHFTQEDLRRWIPILESLGANWLTLRTNETRAIPEEFLRALLEAGIQPIISLPMRIGRLRPKDISPLLEIYSRWGVRHVVIFDRPNMRASWELGDWGRQGLVERFVDHLLPFLLAQQMAGLSPVFPALEPGGDYWDTSFLETALRSIKRRGKQSLLQELTVALYAWCDGKALDWGYGGPERWPEARPYHTPAECQDHRGLHIGDWYRAISEIAIGHAAPMISIAGGVLPKARESRLPFVSDSQAGGAVAVARMLETGKLNPQLRNFSFYLLASDPQHGDHELAWFTSTGQPRPVVDHMREYVRSIPKSFAQMLDKPLEHYVLLAEPRPGHFSESWATLGELVHHARPVVGFSAQEARLARRVTVVADSGAISEETLHALRKAGCDVQRLPRPVLDEVSSGTLL